MRKLSLFAAVTAVAALAAVSVSFGATTAPTATTQGYAPKGDVQTSGVLGTSNSNSAYQREASNFQFRLYSSSETTWTCSKPNPSPNEQPDIVQERNNSTTTQGVIGKIDKQKNQLVGHFLTLDGSSTTTVDGPAVGTCPAGQSGFTYDDNADTVSVGGGSGVQVSINGTAWYDLP